MSLVLLVPDCRKLCCAMLCANASYMLNAMKLVLLVPDCSALCCAMLCAKAGDSASYISGPGHLLTLCMCQGPKKPLESVQALQQEAMHITEMTSTGQHSSKLHITA